MKGNSGPTPTRNATAFLPKAWLTRWIMLALIWTATRASLAAVFGLKNICDENRAPRHAMIPAPGR